MAIEFEYLAEDGSKAVLSLPNYVTVPPKVMWASTAPGEQKMAFRLTGWHAPHPPANPEDVLRSVRAKLGVDTGQ